MNNLKKIAIKKLNDEVDFIKTNYPLQHDYIEYLNKEIKRIGDNI